MQPKHPKYQLFYKLNFFKNLKSFSDLEKAILNLKSRDHQTNNQWRGNALEVFAEALLSTHQAYNMKEVFPDINKAPIELIDKLKMSHYDVGSDGLYVTKNNKVGSYQVKYRKENKLTWNELSNFIGVSERADERRLVTNVTNVSEEFLKKDRVFLTNKTNLQNLTSASFQKIHNWLGQKREQIKRYRKDEYQKKATITIRNLILLCQPSDQSDGDIAGGAASGTAFFISKKGHILTNNHVVEGCKLSKIIYNNKEYDTSLISTDKTLDLALLKVKVRPKSYIPFSSKEPKKRQRITLAGYPLGKGLSDDLKINDGRISALKGFENNSNEITVDVAINPGNSGGPIVNQKGQLVAIAVSGMSKDVTEGINFGIKASAATNFLKSNKISPSAGYLNFSMDEDEIVDLLEESTVYTFCN